MCKLAFLSVALTAAALAQSSWTVQSPDSAVQVRIGLSDKLSYSVSFHGRPAITDSTLGLEIEGRVPWIGSNLKFIEKTERASDTTWTNRLGKNSSLRDHFRELTLAFGTGDSAGSKLAVVVRAYNDGIAFRYQLPLQRGDMRLTRELTEFCFPNDPTV